MMETAAESREQQQSPPPGWGGKRRGAGRRPRDVEKWIAARGLKPASAAEILERADERRIWYRLLHSDDDGIVLRTAMYLTDRRDGRPAQQINVTSVGVTVSADEIAKARGHRAGDCRPVRTGRWHVRRWSPFTGGAEQRRCHVSDVIGI